MEVNGQGFVFSETGGDVPVNHNYIYNGLMKALQNIGISEKEIDERGLNVHAWLLYVAKATSISEYGIAKSGFDYLNSTGSYRA